MINTDLCYAATSDGNSNSETNPPTWERIAVYPPQIELRGLRGSMRLVVVGYDAHGRGVDLTRHASYRTVDERIVRMERTVVHAVTNGDTGIAVTVDGLEQTVPVQVVDAELPSPISFRHETVPALTSLGCNAGKCHGAPKGKGLFRLSLLASNIELDKATLTRETFGRRTNVIQPENSLILRKPTMQVQHGGGLRLRKHDPAYVVLKQWISEGCKTDEPDAPACQKIEIYPPAGHILQPSRPTQQILVVAHYDDGSTRDVTALSQFRSSDDRLARIAANGLVTAHHRGEVAMVVRYGQQVSSQAMTVVDDVHEFAWPDPPVNNYIDELVYNKLQQLRFVPSDITSDEEFLRRVSLDVTGRFPSIARVESFLADQSPDKRSVLIDQLLESPDYAQFWALKWGDLLSLKQDLLSEQGLRKYYDWLVRSWESNQPFDEFCRQLITAQGSTYENPPANYYRAWKDARHWTENTAQVFLGVRIDCARCHNHPFETWSQKNYFGFSAFFDRVQKKSGRRPGEAVIWVRREGKVTRPEGVVLWAVKGQIDPWVPVTGVLPDAGERDLREVFAEWLTRPDNPFFARVAVNRIWAEVMGLGIVDPVDDFRSSNPPTNPKLLDALAHDFVECGFDRKAMLRRILNSRTYQSSAETRPLNEKDDHYFSHAKVRRLTAEQLLDAICHVTGVAETFASLPAGTAATHLPAPHLGGDFMKAFGQPERKTVCACERSADTNIWQAMHLLNGPLLHRKLADADNRFRRGVEAGDSDEKIIRHIYLAAFCRQPSAEELKRTTSYVSATEDRSAALEDICWAVLNSKEFLFQH